MKRAPEQAQQSAAVLGVGGGAGRGVPWRRRQIIAVLLLLPTPATAQELDTAVTLAAGTGVSVGRGDAAVAATMSPMFLDLDVGLIFDGDHTLEWTPSLIMEIQGRVSIGVNPSLKRVWKWKVFSVYAGLGFPFFFAPFTLLGVEPAVGFTFHPLPRLGLALELHADVFFAGSDLPESSVVAKMDASVGVRFHF